MYPSIGNPCFYSVFFITVLVMVAIDMFTLNKQGSHKVSVKEALIWSAIWVGVSCLFAAWLYFNLASNPQYGSIIAKEKTLEFFTGYIIEKSLAIDNIFVFLLIFSSFKVPPQLQRRVLVYGILGAIILRTIMIGLGAVLVREFAWILYIFGAFLLYTGIKMLLPEKKIATDFSHNPVLKLVEKNLRLSKDFQQEKFFVTENGLLYATPLLLVLIMIEVSDVVFAVDSIPAIFAVTTDPFIVLTSNIFAILGLRALYFLLADVAARFHLLKYGLALVLTFIGSKMLLVEFVHIPVRTSLAIVFGTISLSIIISLLTSNPKKHSQ